MRFFGGMGVVFEGRWVVYMGWFVCQMVVGIWKCTRNKEMSGEMRLKGADFSGNRGAYHTPWRSSNTLLSLG